MSLIPYRQREVESVDHLDQLLQALSERHRPIEEAQTSRRRLTSQDAVRKWMHNGAVSRLAELSCPDDPKPRQRSLLYPADEAIHDDLETLENAPSLASTDSGSDIPSVWDSYLLPVPSGQTHSGTTESVTRGDILERNGGYHCGVAGCRSRDKPFNSIAALRHHQRCHKPEEERPHGCEHCHRRFEHPKDLTKHVRIHTGQKVFCPICDQKFTREDQLRRHERRGHGRLNTAENSETRSSIATQTSSTSLLTSDVASRTSVQSHLPSYIPDEDELVAFTSHCEDCQLSAAAIGNQDNRGKSTSSPEQERYARSAEQCYASARLFEELLQTPAATRAVAEYKAFLRTATNGSGTAGSAEHKAATSTTSSAKKSTDGPWQNSSKKRKADNEDSEDPNDDRERDSPSGPASSSTAKKPKEPPYPCPIAIVYRARFGNPSRGCCWMKGHASFPYVVQHLERQHIDTLGGMMAGQSCQITFNQLRTRIPPRSASREFKWRTLVRLLFTAAELPDIPSHIFDANVLQSMYERNTYLEPRAAMVPDLERRNRELQTQIAWLQQSTGLLAPPIGQALVPWSQRHPVTPNQASQPSLPGGASGSSRDTLNTMMRTSPLGSSPSFMQSFDGRDVPPASLLLGPPLPPLAEPHVSLSQSGPGVIQMGRNASGEQQQDRQTHFPAGTPAPTAVPAPHGQWGQTRSSDGMPVRSQAQTQPLDPGHILEIEGVHGFAIDPQHDPSPPNENEDMFDPEDSFLEGDPFRDPFTSAWRTAVVEEPPTLQSDITAGQQGDTSAAAIFGDHRVDLEMSEDALGEYIPSPQPGDSFQRQ